MKRNIAVCSLIVLAAVSRAAASDKTAPTIKTSYTAEQLAALHQAGVCPVDDTATPVAIKDGLLPREIVLTCMVVVEIPSAAAAAPSRNVLRGQLVLRLASEYPVSYRDDLNGLWFGSIVEPDREVLAVRPEGLRGYVFSDARRYPLTFDDVIGRSAIEGIVESATPPSSDQGNEPLPANILAEVDLLNSQ